MAHVNGFRQVTAGDGHSRTAVDSHAIKGGVLRLCAAHPTRARNRPKGEADRDESRGNRNPQFDGETESGRWQRTDDDVCAGTDVASTAAPRDRVGTCDDGGRQAVGTWDYSVQPNVDTWYCPRCCERRLYE